MILLLLACFSRLCNAPSPETAGSVFFAKRAPMQLTNTLGFVLSKNNGDFMKLTQKELDALHEIYHWGRIRGNNRILESAA